MLAEGRDYRFENSILEINNNGKWFPIQIDEYSQMKVLSAGANGITILAHQNIVNRDDVIKVWNPRTENIELYQKQFLNEIRKLASIDNTYIAKVYGGNILDNGYCFASMEYIDGYTLEDVLNGSKSFHVNMKSLFIDLIKALFSYQTQGIVHGDIHSKNIMITRDSKVHLIDFGTSKPTKENQTMEQKKIQSLKRELFLEYESITKILKNNPFFSEEHFRFTVDSKKRELHTKKPFQNVIQLTPILLTETFLSYSIVLGAANHGIFNEECLISLVFAIANSSYLNIPKILDDLFEQNTNIDKKQFFRYFVSHVQTAIYRDDQEAYPQLYGDYIIPVLSCQAYLEWLRSSTFNCSMPSDIDSKIMDIIDDSKIDSIDIYSDSITTMLDIRSKFSWWLYEVKKGDIFIYYYLNSSVREKLVDRELLEKFKAENDKMNDIDDIYNILNFNSIDILFDLINTELFEAYDYFVIHNERMILN